MLALLVATVCSAQPGVVIGVGNRGSVLQVSPVGKRGQLGVELQQVMLTDVIAPRYSQRRGGEVMQFALDAALGEAVTIEPRPPDELIKKLGDEDSVSLYGRVRIGKVQLHELLLKAGWAWVVPSARRDAALVKLEDEARAARRGLWADEAPMEPWLFTELMLLRDVETKVVHAGWDCPHVKETQCAKCGGGRFFSLEEAEAQGFKPHDLCLVGEVLRSARASGGAGIVRNEEGRQLLPVNARRQCVKDFECSLAPEPPCTCPGCGTSWRSATRVEVVMRMTRNFARASCGPVGCPACAGRVVGTKAVCREKQCTAE